MIKIELDEGYVFDILAINNVKIIKSDGDLKIKALNEFKRIADQIELQIGQFLYQKITKSEEYDRLYQANLVVFDLVELAKVDKISASTVDKRNYERYLAKVALQKKFFTSEMKEVKVGYDKGLG